MGNMTSIFCDNPEYMIDYYITIISYIVGDFIKQRIVLNIKKRRKEERGKEGRGRERDRWIG